MLYVDLTTVKVDGVDTLVQTMNSGLDLRVVGSNSKNTDSSRGHAVLTLEVRNEHTQTNFGRGCLYTLEPDLLCLLTVVPSFLSRVCVCVCVCARC